MGIGKLISQYRMGSKMSRSLGRGKNAQRIYTTHIPRNHSSQRFACCAHLTFLVSNSLLPTCSFVILFKNLPSALFSY